MFFPVLLDDGDSQPTSLTVIGTTSFGCSRSWPRVRVRDQRLARWFSYTIRVDVAPRRKRVAPRSRNQSRSLRVRTTRKPVIRSRYPSRLPWRVREGIPSVSDPQSLRPRRPGCSRDSSGPHIHLRRAGGPCRPVPHRGRRRTGRAADPRFPGGAYRARIRFTPARSNRSGSKSSPAHSR